MYKFVFVLFALLFPILLQAQEDIVEEDPDTQYNVKPVIKNGMTAFVINTHINPLDDINVYLSNNGYPLFEEFGQKYDFRFQRATGRKWASYITLSYINRSTQATASLNNSANISGYGAGVGAEYRLLETKHFFIKPNFVINVIQYQMNFTENLSSTSIESILDSEFKQFKMSSFQVPFEFGLNIGVRVNLGRFPITIFGGGGYMLNYANDNWRLGRSVDIPENMNLSSPYFSLGFGFSS